MNVITKLITVLLLYCNCNCNCCCIIYVVEACNKFVTFPFLAHPNTHTRCQHHTPHTAHIQSITFTFTCDLIHIEHDLHHATATPRASPWSRGVRGATRAALDHDHAQRHAHTQPTLDASCRRQCLRFDHHAHGNQVFAIVVDRGTQPFDRSTRYSWCAR